MTKAARERLARLPGGEEAGAFSGQVSLPADVLRLEVGGCRSDPVAREADAGQEAVNGGPRPGRPRRGRAPFRRAAAPSGSRVRCSTPPPGPGRHRPGSQDQVVMRELVESPQVRRRRVFVRHDEAEPIPSAIRLRIAESRGCRRSPFHCGHPGSPWRRSQWSTSTGPRTSPSWHGGCCGRRHR